MKPPKLVQAMRKKIQKIGDRESSGKEESEWRRVAFINFPIGNQPETLRAEPGHIVIIHRDLTHGIPDATRIN
ncbi:MAG: hypothetical protein HY082_01480 [Gammaproteobacteria bacterium]|nr:hypothetical protein [Gammaproteobacteria bacterium]